MRVNQAIVSIFIHETEDYNRIISSVENFFAPSILSSKKNESIVTGHYKNKIIIIEYKFDRKNSNDLLKTILSKMEPADLMLLFATFESHWESRKLYLRFDKQRIIAENRLVLKEGDDILRVVLSFNDSFEKVKEEFRKVVSDRTMYTKF